MYRIVLLISITSLSFSVAAREPDAYERALKLDWQRSTEQGQVAEGLWRQCVASRGAAVDAVSQCLRKSGGQDCGVLTRQYEKLAAQCKRLVADLDRAVAVMGPQKAALTEYMTKNPNGSLYQGTTNVPDFPVDPSNKTAKRDGAPASVGLSRPEAPTAPRLIRPKKRYTDASGQSCVTITGNLAEKMQDRLGTPFVKYSYTISNACGSSFRVRIPYGGEGYARISITPFGRRAWFCTEGYRANPDCRGGIGGAVSFD